MNCYTSVPKKNILETQFIQTFGCLHNIVCYHTKINKLLPHKDKKRIVIVLSCIIMMMVKHLYLVKVNGLYLKIYTPTNPNYLDVLWKIPIEENGFRYVICALTPIIVSQLIYICQNCFVGLHSPHSHNSLGRLNICNSVEQHQRYLPLQ